MPIHSRDAQNSALGSWAFHAPGESFDLTEATCGESYRITLNDPCAVTAGLSWKVEDSAPVCWASVER